jgi:hypothetical protein
MKRTACLMVAIFLGGCSMLPDSAVPDAVRPTSSAAVPRGAHGAGDELLAYMGRLAAMNGSGLPAEATRQRELLQRNPSDVTRVKAALALAMANPGEDGELHALVDPVARASGGDADVRAVASFLQVIAAERRRARENLASAATKLRDERRSAEAQKQRADTLQEKAAQLQQKLDALTEIEKSLTDRQEPPR